MVECTLFMTHCLRLNLQLHTISLVRTCRISSFCTVVWQLARLLLTRCIAQSLGDSWASCVKHMYWLLVAEIQNKVFITELYTKNVCVPVTAHRMYLQWNKSRSVSEVIACRWFYTAVILLLTCSSSFESTTKCETCRELVKNFQEVVMLLITS